MKKIKENFVFFGTSRFSVEVLDTLRSFGLLPALIVTAPDRPAGRGQKITSPPVKKWAEAESIPTLQPEGYKDGKALSDIESMCPNTNRGWGTFIVASYGKILPQDVIDLPKYRSLNIHPSLLPRLRGPSPIQSAILYENETGVTIIRMDDKMDHGPIVTQSKVKYDIWPPDAPTLERDLARKGAELIADILPLWMEGKMVEVPQDHSRATFTKMFKKEDAFLDLKKETPESIYRKVKAYRDRPKPYFFVEGPDSKSIRVIVTEASIDNGALKIERVIPEGRKEIRYEEFLQTQKV